MVADVKFAGVDDFEQKVYNYFFANEQMQQKVFAAIFEFQVIGQRWHANADNSDNHFPNCLSLCSVAIRAFQLLKNELAVPETAQCSFILTRLPQFAQLKLQEWYVDQTKRFCHDSLLSFALRVDRTFKESATERKESFLPSGILKVSVNRSRAVVRSHGDSFSRKRFRSFSPAASKSPKSVPSPRKFSPVPYRSQNNYKGTCAKCGKEGHSIAKCRHATDAEKTAFFQKVKETKAKKAAAYHSTDKSIKNNDNNKKVKFDKNAHDKSHDSADMQH